MGTKTSFKMCGLLCSAEESLFRPWFENVTILIIIVIIVQCDHKLTVVKLIKLVKHCNGWKSQVQFNSCILFQTFGSSCLILITIWWQFEGYLKRTSLVFPSSSLCDIGPFSVFQGNGIIFCLSFHRKAFVSCSFALALINEFYHLSFNSAHGLILLWNHEYVNSSVYNAY